MASLTFRLWVTHFVNWVCKKGTVSLKLNNFNVWFEVRFLFAEDFFFLFFLVWWIQQKLPPLLVLFLDYLLTLGMKGCMVCEPVVILCLHIMLAFLSEKITRVYKSFWWIESFIFWRKWMEQFGALGLHTAFLWAPPTALTFYSGVCGARIYMALWGTTGFSISKNICSFPGERQKG